MRVLDITQVIAGPYAAQQLAQLGANVTRLELPTGEPLRWRGGHDAAAAASGLSTHYQAQAKGRQALHHIDWHSPSAAAELAGHVAQADVVLCNLRAHVLPRLGLDPEHVVARQPRLIWCQMSGYAHDSACADWPAYDNTIQAASGLMILNGGDMHADGLRIGAPVVDYASGMTAVNAVLAALLEQRRSGRGQVVRVAMLAVAQQLMLAQAHDFSVTGKTRKRSGNAAGSGQPLSDVFACAQGSLALAINEPHQFAKLAAALNQTRWLTDARFSNTSARREHAPALRHELQAQLLTQTAEHWEQLLCEVGVAAATVRSLADAQRHPGRTSEPGAAFEMTRGQLNWADLPGPHPHPAPPPNETPPFPSPSPGESP